MGKLSLIVVTSALILGGLVPAATADGVTVSADAPAPWAGGARTVTPLEVVAAQIASRIAGHPVSVSCEGVPRFRSGDGGDALGLVRTLVDERTGTYAKTATLIELTSEVCGPLQRFAQTAPKPTECFDAYRSTSVPCFIGKSVNRGSGTQAICMSTKCYSVVKAGSTAYWNAYGRYAEAILTLAHEAIHTQQAVLGRARPSDDLVEAQAECSGMQWMRWVAEQLGDSQEDGEAIARYFWIGMYPQVGSFRGRPYWSADCRAGGKLDIRAADATVWP